MMNDSLKDYFDKARRLDQDRLISAERSRRLSWFVAVVASAIAAFSRAAVAALTPLKTVEPFMIRVDNATGIIDVVSALTSTVGPMRRKSRNTRRPVCPGARRVCVERGGGEFSDGLAVVERGRTDPDFRCYRGGNPESPQNIYGRGATSRIAIKSISLINSNVVSVRYIRTITRGEDVRTSHGVAATTYT